MALGVRCFVGLSDFLSDVELLCDNGTEIIQLLFNFQEERTKGNVTFLHLII